MQITAERNVETSRDIYLAGKKEWANRMNLLPKQSFAKNLVFSFLAASFILLQTVLVFIGVLNFLKR